MHIQPFIDLKWLISLFENGWICVKKILEVTELVRFSPLTLVSAMSDVLRHSAQRLSHRSLTFSQHSHQLLWHGRWWWWKILIVIAMLATTTSPT
jgi:hypothetical protein